MKILQNNPYRLLGAYANSPTKERLANLNRIKAFLKVGKPVSFPLDLPQHLDSINRTDSMISDADSRLTLPKDQMLYAQFWFVKHTSLDEVAFNHLIDGKINKAEEIWQKKESLSALQNRIVCALIRDDYESAMSCAESLYGNMQYLELFVSTVIGSGGNIDTANLAFSFLDVLCEETDVKKIFPYITNSTWKKHIYDKAVRHLIDNIQEAIDTSKKSQGKGLRARLSAGEALMKGTKNMLLQLRKLLSDSDLQYQMVADKVGLEILQCSIDYFNDSNDANAARNAMALQKFALQTVVGKMAKDRCKENVDTLKKIIANMPPLEVYEEDKNIKEIKEKLHTSYRLPDKICYARILLNSTKPHLQSIKHKLGATNDYYLKMSTLVVSNALHNIIEEVNQAQKTNYVSDNFGQLFLLKRVLEDAWETTTLMDSFDLEPSFKSRYSENREILKGLCEQLGVSTYSIKTTSTPRASSAPSSSRTVSQSPTPTHSTAEQTKSSNDSSNNSDGWRFLHSIFIIGFIGTTIGVMAGETMIGTVIGAVIGAVIGVIVLIRNKGI